MSEKIKEDFSGIIHKNINKISPQLAKRLQLLINTIGCVNSSYEKILDRTRSLFNRLLLEILQAHYNTKQRELDALRVIKSKNCILEPKLTDSVINILVKLNRADGVKCGDKSYNRKVLIKFLLKELHGDQKYDENQVKKVVQTLYRCSCFQIITRQGAPGGLKLREELQNSRDIRSKHDSEIIKLVQSYNIRLTPESWAFLLYKSSNPKILSRIQSLLDKNQKPVTVNELHEEILKVGDKYNIINTINKLKRIQDLLTQSNNSQNKKQASIESLLENILELNNMFIIRQSRAEYC